MKKFIKGILAFKKKVKPQYAQQFKALAEGQNPKALFITCSDSRIVPDIIFSAKPGDFFLVRNVGNIIPIYTAHGDANHIYEVHSEQAAIEFAVNNLNVKNIIIVGHSECGAMMACHKGNIDETTPLGKWLRHAAKSLERLAHIGDYLHDFLPFRKYNQLSQINVLTQLENIMTYPFVAEKVKKKKIHVHGWWFEIKNANVYVYDKKVKDFRLVSDEYLESL